MSSAPELSKGGSLLGLIGNYGGASDSEEEDDYRSRGSSPVSLQTSSPSSLPQTSRQLSIIGAGYGSDSDEEMEDGTRRNSLGGGSKPKRSHKRPADALSHVHVTSEGTVHISSTADASVPSSLSSAIPESYGQEANGSDMDAQASGMNIDDIASDSALALCLLPPEPPGRPNPAVQDKIRNFVAVAQKTGRSFNQTLDQMKDFHNPSILDKIAGLYEIDQLASNYPRDIFDPHGLHQEDFYDVIAADQKRDEERRIAQRNAIEFSNPTPLYPQALLNNPLLKPGLLGATAPSSGPNAHQTALALAAASAANAAVKQRTGRKSLWDAPATGAALPTANPSPSPSPPVISRPSSIQADIAEIVAQKRKEAEALAKKCK